MNDFRIDHLNDRQKQIANAILALVTSKMGEGASGGGCTAFYTPEEWKERGEEYGHGCELIVCYDGGDLAPFFNIDYEAYKLFNQMEEELSEQLNVYAEACTCWYSAVYNSD